MKLVIAEKPSVAKNIAEVIGAKNKKDGYFEGNGYYVSFAFGHLYTLFDTKDYDENMSKWTLDKYPYIPSKFKYKPIDDNGVKKQIKIINSLMKKSTEIINACDADREGALIFAEIYNNSGVNIPVKRLWVTSHTEKDIKEGMRNLKDDFKSLEISGQYRQWIDWLIGVNYTSVYTLKSSGGKVLPVGRVIMPTLNLINERDRAVEKFKPTDIYNLDAEFIINNQMYLCTMVKEDNEIRKEDILELKEKIETKNESKVHSIISVEKNITPSKLFSLTDLQAYITKRYDNFTSDKVLKIAQKLYENKYITYPRTGSKFLNDTQKKDVNEIIEKFKKNNILNINDIDTISFNEESSIFNDKKVDSHPAIIPTYIMPDLNKLSEEDKIIYIEISKRFLSHFMPVSKEEETVLLIASNGVWFKLKGKKLKHIGWKELYTDDIKEIQHKYKQIDSNINEKSQVILNKLLIKESMTTPPKKYTEETLLKAMENCGKKIENEEDILKGFTIGTPATRAETIKKLLQCGYIKQNGKTLEITKLGKDVIKNFPSKKILDLNFTGRIENSLKDIAYEKINVEDFFNEIKLDICSVTNNIKQSKISKIYSDNDIKVLGTCPDCGKKVVENIKAYSCEGTKNNECKFIIWKEDEFFKKFGKKITEGIAKKLILNQKVSIKGFKSVKKEGVKFDANVLIEKDEKTGYWNYKFKFN